VNIYISNTNYIILLGCKTVRVLTYILLTGNDGWNSVRASYDSTNTSHSIIEQLKNAVEHSNRLSDWSVLVMETAQKTVTALREEQLKSAANGINTSTTSGYGKAYTGRNSSRGSPNLGSGSGSESSESSRHDLEETVDRIVLSRLGLLGEPVRHTPGSNGTSTAPRTNESYVIPNPQAGYAEDFTHTISSSGNSEASSHRSRERYGGAEEGLYGLRNERSYSGQESGQYGDQLEQSQAPESEFINRPSSVSDRYRSVKSERGRDVRDEVRSEVRDEVRSGGRRSFRGNESPNGREVTSYHSATHNEANQGDYIHLKQSLHEPELSSIGSPTQRQRRQTSPSRSQPNERPQSADSKNSRSMRSSYPAAATSEALSRPNAINNPSRSFGAGTGTGRRVVSSGNGHMASPSGATSASGKGRGRGTMNSSGYGSVNVKRAAAKPIPVRSGIGNASPGGSSRRPSRQVAGRIIRSSGQTSVQAAAAEDIYIRQRDEEVGLSTHDNMDNMDSRDIGSGGSCVRRSFDQVGSRLPIELPTSRLFTPSGAYIRCFP
jgi:hypothetical protein